MIQGHLHGNGFDRRGRIQTIQPDLLLLWVWINHTNGAVRIVRQLGKFYAALVVNTAGQGAIMIK